MIPLSLNFNIKKISLIDFTASSFAGIGISTRFGSQFVSRIDKINLIDSNHFDIQVQQYFHVLGQLQQQYLVLASFLLDLLDFDAIFRAHVLIKQLLFW